jgi:hypothetical protein
MENSTMKIVGAEAEVELYDKLEPGPEPYINGLTPQH